MVEFLVKNGIPDADKKRCYDCFYLRGAVTTWCINKKAKKFRGTTIPGVCDCQFWKAMRLKEEVSFFSRLFGYYIYVDCEEDE